MGPRGNAGKRGTRALNQLMKIRRTKGGTASTMRDQTQSEVQKIVKNAGMKTTTRLNLLNRVVEIDDYLVNLHMLHLCEILQR
jgi:hypothetical protein